MTLPAEFEQGCEDITELFDSIDPLERGDQSFELKTYNGSKYLRVSKPFNVLDKTNQLSNVDLEEQIEEEDEVQRNPLNTSECSLTHCRKHFHMPTSNNPI